MGLFNKIIDSVKPLMGPVASAVVPGGGQIAGAANKLGGSMGGGGEAVPDMEPLTEPKSGNIMGKINKGIGSNVGKLTTDVAGGFLSDYRQRRNTKKRFEDLTGKGLNPYEAAGAGGGTSVPAQGNTLGSGPATQVQSQQGFQARENAKDRALARYKVDREAGLTERRTVDTELSGMTNRAATEQKTRFDQQLHQERFARLIATMAEGNVRMSVLLRKYNMTGEAWLNPKGPATKEQIRTAERIIDDISQFAHVPNNLKGLLNTMRGATRQTYDAGDIDPVGDAGKKVFDTLGNKLKVKGWTKRTKMNWSGK